jgi:hypothetical protein
LRAVIPYLGGELEAVLEGERWTVRRGGAERSSAYLDFALAELLGDEDSQRVHLLAAQLIERMLVEAQTPPIEETSSTNSSTTVRGKRTSSRSQRRKRLKAST